MAKATGKITFQGEPGAYSHQACVEKCPDFEPVAFPSFHEAIKAVNNGEADRAMLPVENSSYGRVADIHTLLPHSGLHIIGEHFVRVHINLLGLKGSKTSDIKKAYSHTVALGQCRKFLTEHDITPMTGADTAGSAKEISEMGDPASGALASELAGEIYGLDVLARKIEDFQHNTTRFLVMSPEPFHARPSENAEIMTSFVFRVRNIPAALYKAMGGFATNGVNMVKLESYMIDGSFTATQFYADVEGHPDDVNLRLALEELDYFTSSLEILGVYPASKQRKHFGA